MIARAEEEEANMFFLFVTSDDIQNKRPRRKDIESMLKEIFFASERERETVNTLIQTRAKTTTF